MQHVCVCCTEFLVLTLHASQNFQCSGDDKEDQRVAQISAGNLQPDDGSTILWGRKFGKI